MALARALIVATPPSRSLTIEREVRIPQAGGARTEIGLPGTRLVRNEPQTDRDADTKHEFVIHAELPRSSEGLAPTTFLGARSALTCAAAQMVPQSAPIAV